MPERNPFIPSERAQDVKEQTNIDQRKAKEELSRQKAKEERLKHKEQEPVKGEEDEE